MHQVVITLARPGTKTSADQCRRDLEMTRETDKVQRNAMAGNGLFELIEVNTVTGASVRYGYEYFQINLIEVGSGLAHRDARAQPLSNRNTKFDG
ncbi:MAG: hypothetical protein EXR70_05850 [Deltaproteobacteria bacterium]|nr:hypothetical protein [Deltaproteobacteria bacterium]